MKTRMTLEWFLAALTRSVRTIAQTAIGMISVGAAISEIDWRYVVSVSLVAGLISMLTSIATGLPEASSDGDLIVMQGTDTNPETFRFAFNNELEGLKKRKKVTFLVKEDHISQE